MDKAPYFPETDLQALTLVGPTRLDPLLDPLDVLHLDNRQYIVGSRGVDS